MSRDEEDPQARFRKEQDRDFHVCVCVRVCVRLHAHCCPLSLLPDVKECAMWQAHPLWQQLQQSQPVDQTEVAEVTKHTLSYTGDGRTSARTHSTEYICKRKWHTHRNVCRGIQHRWSNTQIIIHPKTTSACSTWWSSSFLSIFPPSFYFPSWVPPSHPSLPVPLFWLPFFLPPSLSASLHSYFPVLSFFYSTLPLALFPNPFFLLFFPCFVLLFSVPSLNSFRVSTLFPFFPSLTLCSFFQSFLSHPSFPYFRPTIFFPPCPSYPYIA